MQKWKGGTVRILIACEFSGRVRNAFNAKGHKAVSCDLRSSMSPGAHIEGDVRKHLRDGWDMMLAFPPCTALANSGNRYYSCTQEREDALDFVCLLMAAPIERICIENPAGAISAAIRKPDQIIQPWQFGHGEVKTTCLWLKGLPKLKPTNIVDGRKETMWRMGASSTRQLERSITYQGIALAMADQWNLSEAQHERVAVTSRIVPIGYSRDNHHRVAW